MNVIRGDNEPFEALLRRFNKKVQEAGIIAEARRRTAYEKPSAVRSRERNKRKRTIAKANREG